MKYYFLPCLITISIIIILLCRYFKQTNNEGFINKSNKITRSNKKTPSNKCDCQTIDTNANNIKVLKHSLNKSDITLKEIQRKMKEMTNTMNKGQRQAAKIKQKSNNTNYDKQKKNK